MKNFFRALLVVGARTSLSLDKMTRKLNECFNEDFAKPTLEALGTYDWIHWIFFLQKEI